MAEDKPKKHPGGRPPLSAEEKALRLAQKEEQAVSASKEENDLFIGHAWAGLTRPPVDLKDLEAVENRVTEYALSCKNSGLRPNPPGMAAWLGVTSEAFSEWLTNPGDDAHKIAAARIYQFLHQSFADMALAGKTSPQITIFFAKNWFSYTDANRIEVAQTIEKAKSLDDLAKEAAALPDGDIIDAPVKDVKKGKKK